MAEGTEQATGRLSRKSLLQIESLRWGGFYREDQHYYSRVPPPLPPSTNSVAIPTQLDCED
jgi:hypothetical protein